MRYADILEQNPRYTSELKKEDWIELTFGKNKKKIFLLRPDDYCTRNRFVLNQEFTLYEVRMGLSGDEQDYTIFLPLAYLHKNKEQSFFEGLETTTAYKQMAVITVQKS